MNWKDFHLEVDSDKLKILMKYNIIQTSITCVPTSSGTNSILKALGFPGASKILDGTSRLDGAITFTPIWKNTFHGHGDW